jgi:uncharacterized membrane protein YcaP (DUF421 family)
VGLFISAFRNALSDAAAALLCAFPHWKPTMPHIFAEMFELAMPWWEFVLRACIVYFILLTMIRASGKRTMGQFTPFDMLLVVLLGNAVQNALLGQDTSVGGGLLLALTLIALNWGVGFVSARSRKVEAMIEGSPVLLARDGKVYKEVLRRELISRADFDRALREAGCIAIDDIQSAVLETNGHITIVAKTQSG